MQSDKISQNSENSSEYGQYTLEEIAKHTEEDDCWLAVYDKVYDITDFLYDHPGSPQVLLKLAGTDATKSFEEQKHDFGHIEILEDFLIGDYIGGQKCPF